MEDKENKDNAKKRQTLPNISSLARSLPSSDKCIPEENEDLKNDLLGKDPDNINDNSNKATNPSKDPDNSSNDK